MKNFLFSCITILLFLTTAIAQGPITLSNGHAQWSRVFQDDRSIDELIKMTYYVIEDIQVMADDIVIGKIKEMSIADKMVSMDLIANSKISGVVVYEFKEGKYRVTLSQIAIATHQGGNEQNYSLKVLLFKEDGTLKGSGSDNHNIQYLDNAFSQIFKLRTTEEW